MRLQPDAIDWIMKHPETWLSEGREYTIAKVATSTAAWALVDKADELVEAHDPEWTATQLLVALVEFLNKQGIERRQYGRE